MRLLHIDSRTSAHAWRIAVETALIALIMLLFCLAPAHGVQHKPHLHSVNPPLVNAATDNDVAWMRDLLRHGANPNAQSPEGASALVCASAFAGPEAVGLLVQYGALRHAGSQQIGLAVLGAAAFGRLANIRILVGHGADVNSTSPLTPLMGAASGGHVAVMRYLLARGARVNTVALQTTALICAAQEGHEDAVRLLLARGADLDASGHAGPALMEALNGHRWTVARLLIASGAKVNVTDGSRSALAVAIGNGDIETVRALRHRGAYIDDSAEHVVIGLKAAARDRMAPVLTDPGPWADVRSAAILRRVDAKIRRLQGISARFEDTARFQRGKRKGQLSRHEVATFQLCRPNLARIEDLRTYYDNHPPSVRYSLDVFDGRTHWAVWSRGRYYEQGPAPSDGTGISTHPAYDELGSFFSPLDVFTSLEEFEGGLKSIRYAGRRAWNGAVYDILAVHVGSIPYVPRDETFWVYVGRDDIIHRVSSLGREQTFTVYSTQTKPTDAAFRFTPSAGMEERADDSWNASTALPYGTTAPDFSVLGKGGKSVKLSDFRGKVVVVDFWSFNQGKSFGAMLRLGAALQPYMDKDVAYVSVNEDGMTDLTQVYQARGAQPDVRKFFDWMVGTVDTAKRDDRIFKSGYKLGEPDGIFVVGKDGRVAGSIMMTDFDFTTTVRDYVDIALRK